MDSVCSVNTIRHFGIKWLNDDMWRLIAKALGEKSGTNDTEANKIACIRFVVVILYIITNCFIIAGVIRHW